MSVLFEQEKFDALNAEITGIQAEMMATDCYFKFIELKAIRGTLLSQIESCTAVVEGEAITIYELAKQQGTEK